MATQRHTYGPTCLFQYSDSAQSAQHPPTAYSPPPRLRSHFFYVSASPIDDPLSPLPDPAAGNASILRTPPKPFSAYDNAALEEAWLGIKKKGSNNRPDSSSKPTGRPQEDEAQQREATGKGRRRVSTELPAEKITTSTFTSGELAGISQQENIDPARFLTNDQNSNHVTSEEVEENYKERGMLERDNQSSRKGLDIGGKPDRVRSIMDSPASGSSLPTRNKRLSHDYGSSPGQYDITGTPFIRAPVQTNSEAPAQYSLDGTAGDTKAGGGSSKFGKSSTLSPISDTNDKAANLPKSSGIADPDSTACGDEDPKAYVPVGISRLHLVELPTLQMKPIYWSPIHDISAVQRGTWFYKETMYPVESDVANQLEVGYEYMKPWTQTYNDEINSCLEIGTEAEVKIVYHLWPADGLVSTEGRPDSKAEKVRSEAIRIAGTIENTAAGSFDSLEPSKPQVRLYGRSGVIYASHMEAQILRPNLLPSIARNRKPLGPIRKGRDIGIPVVRGYDHQLWEQIHPPKNGKAADSARMGAAAARSGTVTSSGRDRCSACNKDDNQQRVSDLILVFHGIGQKLSERVESFHFTHAINSFRRQIHIELGTETIKPWLRPDLGGIMVLPINWRSTVKFDDESGNTHSDSDFGLKDITVDSIPAIRNLISDVLLDIPYYLSHHKTTVLEAAVREANRVYRLWCQNNPDFHQVGRVHLIAHSLGSLIAMDILSKQPTHLPPNLDLTKQPSSTTFEFDTKNLFLCGSPAGFFLLLEKASLIPRKDRTKISSDEYITGQEREAGTYGCIAVDNVYNIMHTNDPIAYRINAAVDVAYAASIQQALVPSSSATWLQTLSSPFRGAPRPPMPLTTVSNAPQTVSLRPTITGTKLPSTIELETHDFDAEEVAEKKMLALNDNGQIDFYLQTGAGPLEFQYWSMLSAHSSYWVIRDFVRFLVVEVGRKEGRQGTVQACRAVKKGRGMATVR
ncbi:hypothetical protein MMC25_005611 [Agyrium rufum]|nr:hypothetical protein [Agyrium rufum]